MNAIKLTNVCKNYQLKNELIKAVDKISYEFEYGKMYVIMGHSGSGKSSLIQCMGLLDSINSGDIFIDGENTSSLSEFSKNKIRNEKIGFIFQDYYLNNTMRAYENVMIPMFINPKFKDINIKERAIKLLNDVGLGDRIKHYPKELSGGEQQRVAIARALANDPMIILADEPAGNLDEETEKYILNVLKELASKGACVIVVSHNISLLDYADVVIKMSHGKIEGEHI